MPRIIFLPCPGVGFLALSWIGSFFLVTRGAFSGQNTHTSRSGWKHLHVPTDKRRVHLPLGQLVIFPNRTLTTIHSIQAENILQFPRTLLRNHGNDAHPTLRRKSHELAALHPTTDVSTLYFSIFQPQGRGDSAPPGGQRWS